ncbi:MAG: cytidine deaminase [Armatimonadetes bacterium]|nr:cytidine deaminase [Armatimonadota bacterium]MDW8122983.1 cytidine deaminase [Armatimonadota bacterium]
MEEYLPSLIQEALRRREQAYCPYSKVRFGAALVGASGKIYGGCNVENASYGLTVCAERNAVFAAVSAGERQFLALVVAGPSAQNSFPCGACRQVLAEFCEDLTIILVGEAGEHLTTSLAELLPKAFRLSAER